MDSVKLAKKSVYSIIGRCSRVVHEFINIFEQKDVLMDVLDSTFYVQDHILGESASNIISTGIMKTEMNPEYRKKYLIAANVTKTSLGWKIKVVVCRTEIA